MKLELENPHQLTSYFIGYNILLAIKNPDAETGGWFSEGTASWAETLVWKAVSSH